MPNSVRKRDKVASLFRGKPEKKILAAALVTGNAQPGKAPISLWNRAYQELKGQDEGLASKYEERLRLFLGDPQADPTSKDQLDRVIELAQQRSEEDQLRIAGVTIKEGLAMGASVVTWAKDWIDQAVQASPQASIAWSIVSMGIPLLTYPAAAEKDCRDGFTVTVSRMKYYAAIEAIICNFGDFHEPAVVDFYKAVLEYQIKAVLHFYRSQASIYVRDILQIDAWKVMLQNIVAKEEQLYRNIMQASSLKTNDSLSAIKTEAVSFVQNLSILVQTSEQQLRIQTGIHEHIERAAALQEKIFSHRTNAEEDKCLQTFRLSNSSEDDSSYEAFKKRNSCRVKGTCIWFTEHANFRHWLAAKAGPLFVTADPGCGKSVLAAYLIDEVLPGPVVYFFFKDQVQHRLNQALCALLHQLLSQRLDLIKMAMPLYKKNGASMTTNTTELWRLFSEVVESFQTVTVVLDALDECLEIDRKQLLSDLQQYLQTSTAKFLLLSRPYQQVVGKLQSLAEDYPNIHIPGEELSDKISLEIELVIKDRVDRLAKEQQLRDDLTEHMLKRLLKVKHRTYLWVYLVLDYLEDGFQETTDGFDNHIKNLPASVNEAYNKILQKSIAAKETARTQAILNILLAARRVLTLVELQAAVEIEQNIQAEYFNDFHLEEQRSFRSSLRRCCGLMVIVVDHKVYFLHQTVREFLTSEHVQIWNGSARFITANIILTDICIKFLKLKESRAVNPSDENYVKSCKQYSGGLYRKPSVETIDPDWITESDMSSLDSVSTEESQLGDPVEINADYPLWKVVDAVQTISAFTSYAEHHWTKHFKACQDDEALTFDLEENAFEFCMPDEEGRTTLSRLQGNILMFSAWYGFHCFIPRCLQRVNIDTQNDAGQTALHMALRRRHVVFAQILLDNRADVDIADESGNTAVHLATSKRLLHIGCTIIGRSRKVSVVNIWGKTPLHELWCDTSDWNAAERSILGQRLLEAGADTNATDRKGSTAMAGVIKYGTIDDMDMFLAHGADLNTIDGVGWTVLYTAFTWNTLDDSMCIYKAQWLMANGCRVNSQNIYGYTVLHVAVIDRSPRVLQMLLQHGAEPNITDIAGRTALIKFMINRNASMWNAAETISKLKILLEAGANPMIKDNYGYSALDHARKLHYNDSTDRDETQHPDVIKFLEEAMQKQSQLQISPNT